MYRIEIASEVKKDIQRLRLNKQQIEKLQLKIKEIAINPRPKSEGGLGEPLKGNLKGYLKFRFDQDYRVVYHLIELEGVMRILVVGLRSDQEVYQSALKRIGR